MKIRLAVLQFSRAERQMGVGKLTGLFLANCFVMEAQALEKGSFYRCRGGYLHSVSLLRFILGPTIECHIRPDVSGRSSKVNTPRSSLMKTRPERDPLETARASTVFHVNVAEVTLAEQAGRAAP
jgi:hypothetical protein